MLSLKELTTGISPLKQDGKNFTTPNGKAEILNNYFFSVYTSEDVSAIPTSEHSNIIISNS